MRTLAITLAALMWAPTSATAVSPVAVDGASQSPLSTAERVAVVAALERGRTIYFYDQAAWHTTDAMVTALPSERLAQVGGWVVEIVRKGYQVTYFGHDGERRFAIYSAFWDPAAGIGEAQSYIDDSHDLDPTQTRLAAAVDVARSQVPRLERCVEERFNFVVLPGKAPTDPILVYLLTPQTSLTSFPMGKHYRLEIANGSVVAERSFTKSCIAIGPEGKKTTALMVTHLLDQVPTEIHVFTVYAAKLPIYVATSNGRTFVVEVEDDGPRIRIIRPNLD